MRRRTCRRGFTLPEVLATMVIVAIILPVAMRGISLSMQAAGNARHKLEAGELAQNKLGELLVDRQQNKLDGSGDFGSDYPEYKWESHSTAITSNLTGDIYQVDVIVHWTAQSQDRTITLSSLVYPSSSTTTSTGSTQ